MELIVMVMVTVEAKQHLLENIKRCTKMIEEHLATGSKDPLELNRIKPINLLYPDAIKVKTTDGIIYKREDGLIHLQTTDGDFLFHSAAGASEFFSMNVI
jgi:hypothetical protein